MFSLSKNVYILAISFAMFMSLYTFNLLLGGLVGGDLSGDPAFASVPIAMIVVGTMISIMIVSKLMQKFGRKTIFLSICVYSILVSSLSIVALYIESFYLFCFGEFLFGMTLATMYQFRFAASEAVSDENKTLAISIVLSGGVLSAFIGPELVVLGEYFFEVNFVGSYLLLDLCFIITFIVFLFYKESDERSQSIKDIQVDSGILVESKRTIWAIAKQPAFLSALLISAIGYMGMTYIMTATPVNMYFIDGYEVEDSKIVMQYHVLAMYLPSVFAILTIKYLGLRNMILLGSLLFFGSLAVLLNDYEVEDYLIGLALLGVAWNFLFVGGTSLLVKTYHEHEKFKVQSLNDLIIFACQVAASIGSGLMIFELGWVNTLYVLVPLLVIQLIIIIRTCYWRKA